MAPPSHYQFLPEHIHVHTIYLDESPLCSFPSHPTNSFSPRTLQLIQTPNPPTHPHSSPPRMTTASLRRRPRQSLMQVRRKPIPQLARIRSQIQRHLLQPLHHHPPRALVTAKLPHRELLALSYAADDGPQEQIRHINGYRLREASESGGVGTDGACVAGGIEGEDFERLDFLWQGKGALDMVVIVFHKNMDWCERETTSERACS